MIPVNVIDNIEVVEDSDQSKTYKLLSDKIQGTIDDVEALKQSIMKLLSTQRYEYPIYSFEYGIDWERLIGKDINFVKIELQRIIKEALINDSRITDVVNFTFEGKGDELTCFFDVVSIYGNITMSKEVNI